MSESTLVKQHAESSFWKPFEKGTIRTSRRDAVRVIVTDGARRCYVDRAISAGKPASFGVRGTAGTHLASVLDKNGKVLDCVSFTLKPETKLETSHGIYGRLAEEIRFMLERSGPRLMMVKGKPRRMLVTWGRDHVHTLKAQKYFMEDVTSTLDYWLETQEKNGMVWDCIHPNPNYPKPTWFGEALGREYSRYEDDMKWIVRRIPVEADCEFLYTEGVWYAWKATGDDAWMARQLPRLEKALEYNSSHPARWSKKHGLVRRSFCMDSWDFVNPHYCKGDHRCINKGDPQFLFHSDNSGLYASYWRIAEMHEALGNVKRAKQLRREGEELRKRANKKLFFKTNYGHMIPETLPEKKVYALVGDERKRMSLSTGYTINRKMPTHAMAVKILKEYIKRGREKKKESFAEWWTMDPPYMPGQWGGYTGTGGSSVGEYMNGAICSIIAGELAKAAFDHGMEQYGVDILERVWKLKERDGGYLYQVYRRLPESPVFPKAKFTTVDLRAVVNRGWKNGACKGVEAWTGEGSNDMRNIPVGRRLFGPIEFDVIDPSKNQGHSVLRFGPGNPAIPSMVTIPVGRLTGKSIYFMHSTAFGAPRDTPTAAYHVEYADGTSQRIWVRPGHEIGPWWGPTDAPDQRRQNDTIDRSTTRLAWRGPNPSWKDVGIYMYGWTNPHPEKPVVAIRAEAFPVRGKGGVMLAAISFSDQPVGYENRIRSHGLPDCWAQAAVYYAIAEGLGGIEDKGRAFDQVQISPRWAASQSDKADVTLHYPASGGYCSYRYAIDRKKHRITLDITGSLEEGLVHCLLPRGAKARKVKVNGRECVFKTVVIEQSTYVDFVLNGIPMGPVVISY